MFDLEAFITTFAPAFKDIAAGSAALVAVYVASRGLQTWNRQLRGTSQYELARRLLRATYRLRDAIDGVRHPVMWGAEMPDPPEDRAANMNRDELRHWGVRQAYGKRWDALAKERSELQAELLEAEVLWGPDVKDLFKPLQELQGELFVAVENHLEATDPRQGEDHRAVYDGIIRERRQVLYDRSDNDGPDPFRAQLLAAVKAIEDYCRQYLDLDVRKK
ncbi:hypothetical protein [Paracidovorax wautersii]|uniref:hypothetical protein n=1 Tax=Paracidovorax wautersii TaxID=1177982 RepID=UPI0031DFA70F